MFVLLSVVSSAIAIPLSIISRASRIASIFFMGFFLSLFPISFPLQDYSSTIPGTCAFSSAAKSSFVSHARSCSDGIQTTCARIMPFCTRHSI